MRGVICSSIGALCVIVARFLVPLYTNPVNTFAPPPSGPRQSSPIALTPDDDFLVNANPDADTISVFNVMGNVPDKIAEIRVGGEPNSVAIHPNGNKAFVANSEGGSISVVNLNKQAEINRFQIGSEPMACALSPNGTRLYVANSSSNNLVVVDTATLGTVATVDLSSSGTAPRSIAVTNDGDGDDTDETVFVALFFGQLRPGKSSGDEGQDDQREGRVVAVSTATNTVVGLTSLSPMAVTGFNSNGQLAPASGLTPYISSTNPQTFTTPTGAFPNQLAAIAIHPTDPRAYVVSTGASPNGPLRFNSNNQGLVSVFDTATRTEVTSGQTGSSFRQEAPLNLNRGVNFDIVNVPRLFLSNPVAMAWRPNGSDAWVVVQNTNVVVRLTVDGNGIPTIGNPLSSGGANSVVRVDLQDVGPGQIQGKAPRGITINSTGARAFVSNFVSRSVTAVDISNPTSPGIIGTAQSTALPTPGTLAAVAQLGAELFFTGRGPQERMSSESWGGCIVCHPDGRSDNVTWMFAAGPRQTVNLDGMFSKEDPNDQRLLNWSAIFDEGPDFELNTRGVFGGRGLIDDDRLFLAIGGASGAAPTDSSLIEQFNNFTGVVSTTNDLRGGRPIPPFIFNIRRDFGIATLSDDRVFIIGGRSGPGQGAFITGRNTVLEFNPRTNRMRRRNSVGFTPRHSLGVAAVKTSDGIRVYAIGGYTSTSPTASPTPLVQEYNPDTDTWRTVATMPQATAQFGITVAGGINTAEPRELIHVVGGNAGSESAPSLVTSSYSVQRFQADPMGPGVWSNFAVTGLTPRRNHGIATALRGVASRIFVIGGQDAAGNVLNTVEEYTNATVPAAVLTPHTPLPAPRARFGISSTLTTNQIYVIGGVDGSGADQTTVFEYTIANNGPTPGPAGTPSGTWVTRGNLSLARRGLGVSTPPGVTNFLPAKSGGRDERQDAIATWIALNVRSSRPPVSSSDPAAIAGRTLFGTDGLAVPGFSCATCHGGSKWTRSTVDFNAPPSPEVGLGLGNERVIGAELRQTLTQSSVLFNVGTFTPNMTGGRVNEIRFNGADISQAIAPLGANGFNIPSLLSVHETAPYFYSGLAQTLEEVLNGSQDHFGGVRYHFVTSTADRANLIAFLRSIDETTPIFP
jgi:YVTN family beta-propeller protein